jgi:ribosome-binding factor A
MSRRIEQINELIQHELSNILSREAFFDNYLVTITSVDCSPDLNQAKIGISVLPDKFFGSALKKIRQQSGLFSKLLNQKIKIRKIPKLIWVADTTEKEAAKIEKILDDIKNEHLPTTM